MGKALLQIARHCFARNRKDKAEEYLKRSWDVFKYYADRTVRECCGVCVVYMRNHEGCLVAFSFLSCLLVCTFSLGRHGGEDGHLQHTL